MAAHANDSIPLQEVEAAPSSDLGIENSHKRSEEFSEQVQNDKLTVENDIELATINSTEAVLDTKKDALDEVNGSANKILEQELKPDLAQFMAACQLGDLPTIQELVTSGKVQATETFSDGITGLHWAAINNRIQTVKYLVEQKVNVNALGGELRASPLHWACRNGLVYVVDYLLCHTDADPALRDAQSYNALHLATHSSNITLLVYMLLSCCGLGKRLYVDEPDSCNRTCLHWAAYQGDIMSVNALLRFGADASKVDNTLFLPLHWAFMKGYKSVLKTLLEAGSDIFAKNDQGKDSFAVAKDMNCYDLWVKVLKEANRDPKKEWAIKYRWLDPRLAKLVTFFTPYVVLPMVFEICSFHNGFAIPKLFLSVILFVAMFYFLSYVIVPNYLLEDKPIPKSPFLAGIFSGTAFWCIIVWITKLLPNISLANVLVNLILAVLIVGFVFCFFKAMFINPGFVPTPTDNEVILEQVKDLIDLGKFDTDHFCVDTFVRKPLRSKYSRFNKRLVARFDHYCPWIYNDVGVRNHKLFMTFVIALHWAIVLFTYLTIDLFSTLEDAPGYDSDDESNQCSLLSDDLCLGFKHHHFHFNLMVWCLLQYIWIASLCLGQMFQISKGLTTWEFRLLNSQMERTSAYNHSTVPPDYGVGIAPASNQPTSPTHRHKLPLTTCIQLVGLDQFFMTAKLTIMSFINRTSSEAYNPLETVDVPFDHGIKQNWLDFWFLGEVKFRSLFFLPIEGENNLNGQVVDYYKLYEVPKHARELV